MSSLAITLPNDNTVKQYISELQKITQFIRSSKHLLTVYWMLLSILWNSQRMMSNLRLSLSPDQHATSRGHS